MSTPNPFNKTTTDTPKTASAAPRPAATPPLPGAGAARAGQGVIAVIDLTGVTASNVIEPGDYLMALSGAENGTTNNGDAKVIWTFTIVEDGPYLGREFQMHTGLSPKARFRFRQVQQALGLTGDQFEITTKLYGILVQGHVIDSEWNERKISSLDQVYPCPAEYGGIGARMSQ